MSHRKVIEDYYCEVNNLSDLLSKLVNSYRLLVGGAAELNQIALARKSEVKDTLKKADKVGDMIDDIIGVLDGTEYNYIKYCKLKSQAIKCKIEMQYVENEIDDELKK